MQSSGGVRGLLRGDGCAPLYIWRQGWDLSLWTSCFRKPCFHAACLLVALSWMWQLWEDDRGQEAVWVPWEEIRLPEPCCRDSGRLRHQELPVMIGLGQMPTARAGRGAWMQQWEKGFLSGYLVIAWGHSPHIFCHFHSAVWRTSQRQGSGEPVAVLHVLQCELEAFSLPLTLRPFWKYWEGTGK